MSGSTRPEPGPQRVLLSFEPRAVFRDGSMLGRTSWGFVETIRRPDGQQVPSSRTAESGYALATAEGDVTRVIAISPPAKNFAEVSRGPGMGGGGSAIPFVEPLYASMSQDGSRMAFGITTITSQQAGALKVVVIGMRGDTLVNRNFPFAPVALAKRTTDSAIAEVMKRYRPSPESKSPPSFSPAMADEMESKLRAGVPVGRSVYRSLSLGIDNSIWIWLPNSPEGGREFLVLDERGNPYGGVKLPRNATLVRASLSDVWALEYDADGLPSIVRYRITRDG